MKRNLNHFILTASSLVLFFSSCDNNEFPNLNYSRLETNMPEAIAQGGVKFSATVLSLSSDTIVDHGFIWTKLLAAPININSSEKISLGKYEGTSRFEATMEAGFEEGETYTVRAFLQSSNFIFLGNPLSFKSLGSKTPTIQDISPATGTWGDTIVLTGDNYGLTPIVPKVLFDTLTARVISKTQTEIRCIVPNNLTKNPSDISIITFGTTSKATTKFTLKSPTITNVSETLVSFEDTLTLAGNFIVSQKERVQVKVGSSIAQILDYKVSELKFKIPSTLNTIENDILVTVNGQHATFQEKLYLKAPVIFNLDPEVILDYNSTIKINGDYFSPIMANNLVTVAGMTAQLISSTKKQIQFRLPQSLQTRGSFNVTVQVLGQSSEPVQLIINSPFRRLANFPTTLNDGYYATTFELNNEFYFGLGQSSNELYVYNSNTDTWTKKTNYPGTSSSTGYNFVLDGYAYVGKGANSDFWRYSPELNSWTLLATIPDLYNYGNRQGAVVNSSGYIIEAGNYFRILNYNVANDSWSEQLISDTFVSLNILNGAFNYNNSIYTIASSPNYSGLFFSIFVYDISTNSYSIIDQFEDEYLEGVFFNGKGIQVGTTIYFFQNNTLYGFDMASQTWSRKNIYSPVPDMGNILFSRDQKLFLGRPNSSNNTYEFWELDLSIVP
jgi:IPT/TIG domain